MTAAIKRKREACRSCDAAAPSQPAAPPQPLPQAQYPFQMLGSDFFSYGGKDYFVINDRYSNFLSVYHGSATSEAFIKVLREYFSNWGIPDELATDGATVYTSALTRQFLRQYGVRHRLSSAYFPHSNQFSEGSVKAAKRLIRENTSKDGKLNFDTFAQALLTHRNTPDQTGASPAQIVFGRNIKGFFPSKPGSLMLNPEWKLVLERRELALARRHCKRGEELGEHTRTLAPLNTGQVVLVQNQQGNKPKRWDRTGLVVEVKPNDQYLVRMDGSGSASLRNRRFLRPTTPYSSQATPYQDSSIPLLTPEISDDSSSTPPHPPAPSPAEQLDEEQEAGTFLELLEDLEEQEQEKKGHRKDEQETVTSPSPTPRHTTRVRKPAKLAPGMVHYH
jgi:transposase InsO family protein